MPATTPNYALPYPLGFESPRGDIALRSLAEAVDAEFVRLSSTVATLNATAGLDQSITLATGQVDVAGTNVSFTTAHAGAELLVVASFDFAYSNTAGHEGDEMVGYLYVDGVEQPEKAVMRTLPNNRRTVLQVWQVELANAGTHTVKLRADTTADAGTQVIGNHTGFSAYLLDG